jgi:hypothetical protein
MKNYLPFLREPQRMRAAEVLLLCRGAPNRFRERTGCLNDNPYSYVTAFQFSKTVPANVTVSGFRSGVIPERAFAPCEAFGGSWTLLSAGAANVLPRATEDHDCAITVL